MAGCRRSVRALRAHGIKTLADLTVRVPRRRRWWVGVPGLGASGARQIEAFFDAHPDLTAQPRALVRLDTRGTLFNEPRIQRRWPYSFAVKELFQHLGATHSTSERNAP